MPKLSSTATSELTALFSKIQARYNQTGSSSPTPISSTIDKIGQPIITLKDIEFNVLKTDENYAILQDKFEFKTTKINQDDLDDLCLQPQIKDKVKYLKVACISDTHNEHNQFILNVQNKTCAIPADADILIHAGDMTYYADIKELDHFIKFLWDYVAKNTKHIILIAGNRDMAFDARYDRKNCWHDFKHSMEETRQVFENFNAKQLKHFPDSPCKIYYLENESLSLLGYNFYGSPNTLTGGSDTAFKIPEGNVSALLDNWSKIPENTDVLITHSPPFGIGDVSQLFDKNSGCIVLLKQLIEKIQPKFHIFGHIHEERGIYKLEGIEELKNCNFINAANLKFRRNGIHQEVFNFYLPRKASSE